MDYNKMSYEELVEQLGWNFKMLNITTVKDTFIQCSENICKLQDILLEKNKKYFDKHFDNMEEKILNETTTFCMECPSKECCPEEECVLYRIEQIVVGKKDKEKPLKGQMTIYDVSNNNL